jgi:hypothetical protein
MEYWKSQMFQVDMFMAINGLKWNPSSVVNFYTSGQFYKEFSEPRDCQEYLKNSRVTLDKIAVIQEELVLSLLETKTRPAPAKHSEEPVLEKPAIKEGYAQSVSSKTTTISNVQTQSGAKVEPIPDSQISVQPIEEKDEYEPQDFVSIDAYYDYLDYGDLDGLITNKNKKMVEITHELVKEENMKTQNEAHIQHLIEENRQHWAQIDANKGISQLKEDLKKALLKPEPQVDFRFRLLNDLGVPTLDILRYQAEAEFPLTSFIGEYDTYTQEEIDALEDEKRYEAHWELSPLGFATQVYQRSNDMISRISNPHDPMYIS